MATRREMLDWEHFQDVHWTLLDTEQQDILEISISLVYTINIKVGQIHLAKENSIHL